MFLENILNLYTPFFTIPPSTQPIQRKKKTKLFPPMLTLVPKKLIKREASKNIRELQAKDKTQTIARVGFAQEGKNKYSYAWKNGTQARTIMIKGMPITFFAAQPYYCPKNGGDLHGVVGGLTQAFGWNVHNRPDVSRATHFVYYVYIKNGSAYISTEFIDYDPGTRGAQGGFHSEPNLDRAHGCKQDCITDTELRRRSNGAVNMQEYQRSRYDGYRWRIYGSDGWKAQKILISGDNRLFRIAVPFNRDFVERYFINTGFGDNKFNIQKGELERVQHVIYVTEKPGQPLTPYKRGMKLIEYKKDPTEYRRQSLGYRNHESVRIGVGQELLFVSDKKNTGKIIITPVE